MSNPYLVVLSLMIFAVCVPVLDTEWNQLCRRHLVLNQRKKPIDACNVCGSVSSTCSSAGAQLQQDIHQSAAATKLQPPLLLSATLPSTSPLSAWSKSGHAFTPIPQALAQCRVQCSRLQHRSAAHGSSKLSQHIASMEQAMQALRNLCLSFKAKKQAGGANGCSSCIPPPPDNHHQRTSPNPPMLHPL